jgi:hypothetical protein
MPANYVDPYFVKFFGGKTPQQVTAEIASQMPTAMADIDPAFSQSYAPYTSKESIEKVINTVASTPGASKKLFSDKNYGMPEQDAQYITGMAFGDEYGKLMVDYGLMTNIANQVNIKGEKNFIETSLPEIVFAYANGPAESQKDLQDFLGALPKAGFTQEDAPRLQAGFDKGQAQASYIKSISPEFKVDTGFGSMLKAAASNPLAQITLAAFLPTIGQAVGTALGTSAAAGSAITSAGLQAAQGRPLEDIAKGAAIGAAAGSVGGDVAKSTGSTVAGRVAGQATGGLLAGADAGKVAENIGTSLISGGIANTAAEATGSALTGGFLGSTAAGLLGGNDLESSLVNSAINTGVRAAIAPTTPTAPNYTKTSSDVAALYGNEGYTGNKLSGGLMTDEEFNSLLDEFSNYMPMSDPSAFDAGAAAAADVARNYDLSLLDEFSNYMPMSDPSAFDAGAAAAAKVAADYGSFTADENQTAAEVARLLRQNNASPAADTPEFTANTFNVAKILSTLGDAGKTVLQLAKDNPTIAGSLIGAVTGAVGAKSAPTSTTTTTLMDPQLRAAYLENLETAKKTAAGLGVRQFAEPNQMYTDAEKRLYNLGMTPFGAEDISKFYNPYQEEVIQGALGDIERTRQIQEQANMEQATRARAFGGSRQGVVSGLTNEAALRQAATTGANLRATGFNTAADLGFRARTADTSGLRTSIDLGTARTALEQAKLDAARNLGIERLGITSGSLGIGIPNLGGSTSQPLYSSTAGGAISGGLTGSVIGSLLEPKK